MVNRAGGLRGLDSSLPKLYDSKPSINTKMSYGHFEARMRRKDVEASPSVALLTRDFLIEEVWGPDYFGDTKTLDVHVKRLRRKVEAEAHEPVHLLTVRGLGYKFVD